MEFKAFKAFKGNLENKYGEKFETGVVFSKNSDNLKFGEFGHGYHVAINLVDTFRFFNPCFDNTYCEVLCSGNVLLQKDYLYQSDDMYVVEKFQITKILSREDILSYVYQASPKDFESYLYLFPFTKDELVSLREWVLSLGGDYLRVFQVANAYQTGEISTFKRNRKYLRKSL